MNLKEWNCKCKCKSKKAHGARWMFISIYKKNTNFIKKSNKPKKHLVDKLESTMESDLNLDLNSESITEYNNLEDINVSNILVPKVKYDSACNKIIIIMENHDKINDSRLRQNNLIELTDLMKL